MTNYVEIPTYIKQEDLSNYNEEFNQSIRQLLDDSWWVLPSITAAQSVTLEPSMPVGSVFFNTNTAKLNVKTAAGVIEEIQSI
jgi:hypothetical protein